MLTAAHGLNLLLTGVFDAIGRLLAPLGPVWSLTVISVMTGALMLWIFGLVSDQERIRESKRRVMGNLIAVRLFQNSLAVFFRTQGRILRHTLAYLRFSFMPVLVLIGPVVLILVQLNWRYAVRPPEPGEAVVVKAGFRDSTLPPGRVDLSAPADVAVEATVRMPASGEIAWRLRAKRAGAHDLKITVGGETVGARLLTGSTPRLLSSLRSGGGPLTLLLNPGQPPLDPASAVASLTVDYPERALTLAGWKLNWLVVFLVVSVAAGFLLKGVFHVEI